MPVRLYCPRMRGYTRRMRVAVLLLLAFLAVPAAATVVNFESGHVRPLALAADGDTLFAVNTPDNRLEILAVTAAGLQHRTSVPVGLDPVAVAEAPDGRVWVVNHLSDSISIVDVDADPPRVVGTLQVGDEPRDIVFAGPGRMRAFVAAAHRGQNVPFDPQLLTPGVGRADVWVFDAESGAATAIVNLFADTPRALAVSADGERVYAAAFHSGNRTSIVSQEAVCDGGADAPPCEVEGKLMPGGLPAPNESSDGVPAPEVGLIVRRDAEGAWLDELGRDWREALRIDLPDEDVFVIDAAGETPAQVGVFAGVGTILYNMAVNPVTGRVYVSNTEARNEIRFEPRLRGNQHQSRITVLDGDTVTPRRLNTHLDYERMSFTAEERAASLALPSGMAVSADGSTLYLAALGSNAVAVIDTAALEAGSRVPDAAQNIRLAGGGPTGLVLDEERGRLYVATRFDNAVAVVDPARPEVIGAVALHSPEPAQVITGRRFLYDASLTSGNGEAACASCHVFGDFDSLSWDLGDPDGVVLPNPNPVADPRRPPGEFHPLKGPMTTQTFRGMADSGALHWRGDRSGGYDPDGDPLDPRAAFRQFNGAFVSLLGGSRGLDAEELEAFTDFSLGIVPPPNPVRALDNSLTADQQRAAQVFLERENCTNCHTFDPASRFFGTSGLTAINPNPGTMQTFKVPHLRGLYQRVGRFGIFPIPPGLTGVETGWLGDQVRGFSFLNDGAGILPPETAAFLLVFDTNLAPVVGQQETLTTAADAAAAERIGLLLDRADAGECDLTLHGVVDGEARGWLYAGAGFLLTDREGEEPVVEAALRASVGDVVDTLTYTCQPPQTGRRFALDRDADGALDGDERDAGSNPADPASLPGMATPTPTATASPTDPLATATPQPESCSGDCDKDGAVTVDEIVRAVNIALGTVEPETCVAADRGGDGAVTVDELVAAVARALTGCGGSAAAG